jgi:squalene synthase HpnC
VSVHHYENFPVASLLCPPALRPAVVAIYRYARTADDIADEGSADAGTRLAELADYRRNLAAALEGRPAGPRWRPVFEPLALNIRRHGLPASALHALLDAFEQDVRNPVYADRAGLLAYCQLSASPIGRLLLHLYGQQGAQALRQSDAICSALQLINFWQDLGLDVSRGRHYVPDSDLARHAMARAELQPGAATRASRDLVRDLCGWSRELMLAGAPLAVALPGRAGWELRLVVQGGLRILEKIARMDYATLERRPTLRAMDALPLAWRALMMATQPR